MAEAALSLREVRAIIRQLFPPGRLYDWFNTKAKIYKLINATAQTFKQYGFDMVDTLRRETTPRTLVDNLPKYEGALGISETNVARSGTVAQRRAAVIAKFRESGGFTKSNVRSIMAPLLGYTSAGALQVLECDREALRLLHSYTPPSDTTIGAAGTTRVSFEVRYDGGEVSHAGAQLTLYFADADLSQYSFVLTSPDGQQKTWNRSGGWSHSPLVLYGKEFAHAKTQGPWTLAITNNSVSPNTLYTGSTLFVEGIGPGLSTGGAIVHWGVFADPALVNSPDYASVENAIKRIKHAHTVGDLVRSIAAAPETDVAIPNRFIPE